MAVRYICTKTNPLDTFSNGKNWIYEYDNLATKVDPDYVCQEDFRATVKGVIVRSEVEYGDLDFEAKKRYRCQEVKEKDAKIRECSGFIFNEVKFGLSEKNITEYESIKNSAQFLTYPFPYPDFEYNSYYLQQAEVIPLWEAAQQKYIAVAASGQPIINAIHQATDEDELDAVIDDRPLITQ